MGGGDLSGRCSPVCNAINTAVSVCGGGVKVVDIIMYIKPSKFNIEVTHSSICGWYVVCIGG